MNKYANTLLAMGVANAAALESSSNTNEQLAQTESDMPVMASMGMPMFSMPTPALIMAVPQMAQEA